MDAFQFVLFLHVLIIFGVVVMKILISNVKEHPNNFKQDQQTMANIEDSIDVTVLDNLTPNNLKRVSKFNELQIEIYTNLLVAVKRVSEVKPLSKTDVINRWNDMVDIAENP